MPTSVGENSKLSINIIDAQDFNAIPMYDEFIVVSKVSELNDWLIAWYIMLFIL